MAIFLKHVLGDDRSVIQGSFMWAKHILYLCGSTLEIRVSLVPSNMFLHPVIILLTVQGSASFEDSFFIYVSGLSYCLYSSLQPCSHLLWKGWPLGSLVCGVSCVCHLPIYCSGSGVIFDCIDSWSFFSPYFYVKRLLRKLISK